MRRNTTSEKLEKKIEKLQAEEAKKAQKQKEEREKKEKKEAKKREKEEAKKLKKTNKHQTAPANQQPAKITTTEENLIRAQLSQLTHPQATAVFPNGSNHTQTTATLNTSSTPHNPSSPSRGHLGSISSLITPSNTAPVIPMQPQQVKVKNLVTSSQNIYQDIPTVAPTPLPRDANNVYGSMPTMPTDPQEQTLYGSMPTGPGDYGFMPTELERQPSVIDKSIVQPQPPQNSNSNNTYGVMPVEQDNIYQAIIRENNQPPANQTQTMSGNIYANPTFAKPPIPAPNNTYQSVSITKSVVQEEYQSMLTPPVIQEQLKSKNPSAHLYQRTIPNKDPQSGLKQEENPSSKSNPHSHLYQSSIIREDAKRETRTERSPSVTTTAKPPAVPTPASTKYTNKHGEFYQSVLDPKLQNSDSEKPKEGPKKSVWSTNARPKSNYPAETNPQPTPQVNDSSTTNNGYH